MNHKAEKGELRTLVINSNDRINGSAIDKAQYGVDWDNILGSGKYKLHWNYIETQIGANPPTNLVATTTSTTSASISFTPASGIITSYTVTSSPSGFTGTGASSPIVVSGLNPNTVYTFTATSNGNFGTSGASLPSNAITTISNAPIIGTATQTGTTTANIAFTAPSGTGTITSYTATSSPATSPISGASSPIAFTGLNPNVVYTFTVTATNAGGTSAPSASSNSITTIPNAPVIGTATQTGTTTADVAFTSPSGTATITSYTATSSPATSPISGASSPIAFTGLNPNVVYTFTITATNAGGTSASSSASNAITTIPDAPVIGTATQTGTTTANVAFTAPSGTATITSYTATSSPATSPISGASSPIAFTGLNPNVVYTFTITATNAGGTSASSSASNAITTIPNAPTIGTATTTGTTTANVAFTAPSGTATITSYTATSSPATSPISGASSPIAFTGLNPNVVYTFTITATNAGGTSASSSASNAITTISNAPTIGTATTTGTTTANVAFTAPSGTGTITSYTATSSPATSPISGASSPIAFTGLNPNVVYTFTVKATNAGGTSASSSASNSITTISNAPTIGTATSTGTTTATVAFTAPSGTATITSYTATSSPATTPISGATSPITYTGLTPNTAYTFTVTATNAGGISAPSASSNSITTSMTAFQQLLVSKPPWGQYNASNWVQGTLTLTDMTGNGRHGVGAGGITQINSSGNGATASINSIGGTTTATILWPTGSIPNPYTMCNITRYATGTQNRVLQSETDNWLQGHHGQGAGGVKRGVHYNGTWKTNQVNTGTITNWLNFCTTSGNTFPNNVLLDGTGVGIASGSNGIVSKLAINIGPFVNEKSDWSFSQLIIWNQVLTPAEMVIVSNAYTNFLSTGILS